MFTLHCTKKLLDRVKPTVTASPTEPSTLLGNWYATALFWKPQLVLLVNERTLLPVLMSLAPASGVAARFPHHLAGVLDAHGLPQSFIDRELLQMRDVQFAKTSNRSVVGIMNEFSYLAEVFADYIDTGGLLALSIKLSETPCSPLYKTHISPRRALLALACGDGVSSL